MNQKIKELSDYEKKTKHPRLLQRIHVVQMVLAGLSGQEIQVIKNLSHGTVSLYKTLYERGGIEALLSWKCVGRKGVLSDEQKKILKDKGEQEGFDTAQEAQDFIRKEFGVEYKIRWVQYLLKKENSHTKRQKKRLEIIQ